MKRHQMTNFLLKNLKRAIKLGVCVFITAILVNLSTAFHEQYLYTYKGDAVVKLYTEQGSGTGFNIKHNGKYYILTNKHVCKMSRTQLRSKGSHGTGIHDIIAVYDKHDLCLLQGLPKNNYITMADRVIMREKIYIVGHPRGAPLTMESGFVIARTTVELVAEPGEKCDKVVKLPPFFAFLRGKDTLCLKYFSALQSNAVSFGGNSGSPVLDGFGNAVGVLFAGQRSVEALSFIVPLEAIQDFLSTID